MLTYSNMGGGSLELNCNKKKGFTLIELLAVIVILTIIAVITTPIITGIIDNSKKASFERSVEGIVNGTETDVALKLNDNGYIYTIENGIIDNLDENIKVSNITGFTGIIKYDSEANVSYAIYNSKWCMVKSGEKVTTSEYNGKCEIPKMPFENGYTVYFDVTTGEKCSNYHKDNSLTDYNGTSNTKTTDNQNGCLKFYSFNYEKGDTKVNLLLDHNTTGTAYWTDENTESNINGPITVLTKLKESTNSWVGIEIPNNYTVTQTGSGNYTIPYKDENYKARLITADEVAKITGNVLFNENTTKYYNYFYFDTNTQTASSTCTEGNTTGCQYGWLYDRTSTLCITYGCLNNADSAMSGWGYWTSTSAFGITNYVWEVNHVGDLLKYNVNRNNGYGIRPVIEVLKSKLQ